VVDFAAKLARKHARKDEEKERGQDARRGSTTLRQTIGPDASFEKLAQQLIEAADKVPCEIDEYQSGLRYIIGEVEIALQASKECEG
jgi:hypothetical protein